MTEPELKIADRLAVDRTRMAVERTLMAWVRTSLSMISFGFTIYKFLQVFQEQASSPVLRPQSPRNLGLMLIGIGTAALIAASVQYRQQVTGLIPGQPYRYWDLTFIVACLLALLGLLMFGSILLSTGPFG